MYRRTIERITRIISLMLVLCISATACSDGQTSQSGAVSSATSTSVTASSRSSETQASSTEPLIQTETIEVAEDYTAEVIESFDVTSDVTGFPTEDIPTDVTTPAPDVTEEPSVTSIITTASTTVKIKPVTTASPPAVEPPKTVEPVVIPDVLTVNAPGKASVVNGDAVLDYSNAKLGYISASYRGESARAKIRIICGDETYDHDLAADGTFEYFPLSQGSGSYSVQIYEQLEGRSYSTVFDEPVEFNASIADELSMYLYPNKYVDFERSSDCVEKGAQICAGADGTIEKLAAIFGYITNNVTYDYDLAATVKSGYVPDPDATLARGKGICFDYASLFAAMARSQGIPTRLVIGYATEIYHAWNEVYTEETGWIAAEVLLSSKGYNIVDSTFYAGAADKAAMAEYITNSANYTAVFRY